MGRISIILIITVAVIIITGVTGYAFFDSPIDGTPNDKKSMTAPLAWKPSQPMAKEEGKPVETNPSEGPEKRTAPPALPQEEEEFPDQIRRARIPLTGPVPS
ncbi:MAG: hypothetical protein JEZ12_05275 [Desulfobacterium sp.]|nr:hypothetical protein [Desulfobacterium sp.]